jgi:hypothetical protein
MTERNANDGEANDIGDGEGIRSRQQRHAGGLVSGANKEVGPVRRYVGADRATLTQGRQRSSAVPGVIT